MIKMLLSHTMEIDEPDLALEEITKLLEPDTSLLKNSLGIISCHYDYVHSGVVDKLCHELPFDIIGTVTSGQAVEDNAETFMLTLTVLTSDDTIFETRLSEPLSNQSKNAVKEAYNNAAEGHNAKPALIFAVAGFLAGNVGDDYVDALTEASDGAPCFGTIAVDDTLDFSNSFIIYNGKEYKDRLALSLIYGDIDPKFYIATISDHKIMDDPALITKSKDNVIMEINEKPVIEYFKSLGLGEATEKMYSMVSMPFMVDYNDGTPPVSKIFVTMDENGYAVCAGKMPEGSHLYMGVFDKEDVLLTTGNAMKKIFEENPQAKGMLIYSCISRLMSLGSSSMAELELVDELNKENIHVPFMMAYSGGEMCPTEIGKGKAVNRFHNNAFIACII